MIVEIYSNNVSFPKEAINKSHLIYLFLPSQTYKPEEIGKIREDVFSFLEKFNDVVCVQLSWSDLLIFSNQNEIFSSIQAFINEREYKAFVEKQDVDTTQIQFQIEELIDKARS